jgi:Rap1a immunity proteins
MKTFLCGIILILAISISAASDGLSVSEGINFNRYLTLMERLNNGDKTLTLDERVLINYGNGFIMGFMNTVGYEQNVLGSELLFILPDKITLGQINLIMTKYLKEHPEQLHEYTLVLLYRALAQAYPNPKRKAPNR